MKPLVINQFKGAKTVTSNKGLKTNAAFFSRTTDFQGKLSQSHYAIKFPVSGTEHYIVGNRKYSVDDKSYLLTNAGQEIGAYIKSKSEVLGLCVGFTRDYVSNLAGSIAQKLEKGIDNPFDVKNSINFITKKNKLNGDQLSLALNKVKLDVLKNKIKDNYEEEQFYIALGELLITNQARIYSDIERLPHAKFSTREEIYRRICLMNDYIHDNYKNDISLDQLSQISSLSKFHAIRCYQKINNISPYRKIIILRLEDAKQLIKNGMSIIDAANEANFSDHRALSKLFKRHFNMTPSEYKAIHVSA